MAQLEHLICLDCAGRIQRYPDDMDPDFNETLIMGTLIPRREQPPDGYYPDIYFCDQCGCEMPLISHAVAWCQWRAGTNKEGWEHLFLTDMKVIKEIKRDIVYPDEGRCSNCGADIPTHAMELPCARCGYRP